MFYNKAIVRKAGLDFEAAPPKTLKEFDAALAKIKATGAIPIVVDEAAQGVPWFLCWVGDYWWAQMTGNPTIIEQTYGRKKFTDDKGLLATLEYYNSLFKKGFFREDLLTANDSHSQFLQGKGAIWPAVPSFLADSEKTLGADMGILMPPEMDPKAKLTNSTIGGPGQSFVVAKNTKYPETGREADVLPELQGGGTGRLEDQQLPDRALGHYHSGNRLGAGQQHRQAAQVRRDVQLLGGQPADRRTRRGLLHPGRAGGRRQDDPPAVRPGDGQEGWAIVRTLPEAGYRIRHRGASRGVVFSPALRRPRRAANMALSV